MTDGLAVPPPADAVQLAAEHVLTRLQRLALKPHLLGADEWLRGFAFDLAAGTLDTAAPAIAAQAAATEQERIGKLADLASRLLSQFWEAGHPGRPCHRTGWVNDEQLAAWRKELADLLDGQP